MNTFGAKSLRNLDTVDERLQVFAWAMLSYIDVSCLEGYRSEEEQLVHFMAGRSKLRRGKHNHKPSRAVHLAPYPYQEKDLRPYYLMGGIAKAVARSLNIGIRWGGDWDGDGDLNDQTFNDLMHFELED